MGSVGWHNARRSGLQELPLDFAFLLDERFDAAFPIQRLMASPLLSVLIGGHVPSVGLGMRAGDVRALGRGQIARYWIIRATLLITVRINNVRLVPFVCIQIGAGLR